MKKDKSSRTHGNATNPQPILTMCKEKNNSMELEWRTTARLVELWRE